MTPLDRQPVIRANGLCKRYGSAQVLSEVTLSVRAGEIAALVGPSGSGKSTLLRCFNGLEDFQEGELEVVGTGLSPALARKERLSRVSAVRRRVGMVFQQFNLFPHRSALENVIEAPIYVLKSPRHEAIALAEELLARVGMADRLHHLPEMLSGGQQQRVAIARALAMNPEVLLFDEPTSALDPRMAAEVESVITDLAARGQTMVVVTHALSLVRRTAHTVHVLESGHLVESGPAQQVLTSPAKEATRRFLHDASR